jgi:hypothetical protein
MVDLTEIILALENTRAVVFQSLFYQVLSVSQRFAFEVLFGLPFALDFVNSIILFGQLIEYSIVKPYTKNLIIFL